MNAPVALSQGDTFFLRRNKDHLHVIASKPEWDNGRVLVFPIVTFRREWPNPDTACLLSPGDHPFIRHQSAIDYGRGKVGMVEKLNEAARAGELILDVAVNERVQRKVLQGCRTSTRLNTECAEMIQRISAHIPCVDS